MKAVKQIDGSNTSIGSAFPSPSQLLRASLRRIDHKIQQTQGARKGGADTLRASSEASRVPPPAARAPNRGRYAWKSAHMAARTQAAAAEPVENADANGEQTEQGLRARR